MKSKSVFSIALLLVFGFGIFIYISSRKPSPELKEFPWAQERKDALTQIEVESFKEGSAEKYTLAFQEGLWGFTKPDFYSTLPERSSVFATAFMNLKPKEVLSGVSAEEYNAYGFNSPQMKILAKFKGRPDVSLILGAETSVGEDMYVALSELKENAFIVPAKDMKIFLNGMNSLINNKILKQSAEDVVALDFRNLKNEEMGFVKTNGFWVQIPSKVSNRDWGMRRFILTLSDLVFETNDIMYRVSGGQAAEQGIDTAKAPYLSLGFADGKKSTIYIGPRTENRYAVYVPEMKLLAWMQPALVHGVFFTASKDLEIKKP